MTKLLRIFALMTAALMVFVMIGCGGDDEADKDTTKPTMVSANPASGDLAANASITLTFSEKMGSVGTSSGTATLDSGGKTATIAPTGEWPSGELKLTIVGKDVAGNELEGTSLTYTIKAADKDAPDIVAASCVPPNGEAGVDPATVNADKKVVIVFSEAMGDAKVDSFEPADVKFEAVFDGDKTLTVSFLGGYTLSNEQTIKINIIGKDKAGNALKTTVYTFTTMKKEEA